MKSGPGGEAVASGDAPAPMSRRSTHGPPAVVVLAARLLLGCLLGCLAGPTCVRAIELDEAYRFLGPYEVTASAGIRLYYPAGCRGVIPRVLSSFVAVRERLLGHFPDQRDFEVTVLLTDHDDRESGGIDATFDLVTLGLYEEMGSLSTRGYSLADRFAVRLAYTLIMRTLGAAHSALRRRIGLLSIPPWYVEGLALYYAFPLDVWHTTRLLDLARHRHLFTLDELDTIQSRRARVREEMSFQVHGMLEFWHRGASADAGLQVLQQIRGRPGQFAELFRRAFGVSLKEGVRRYHEYIQAECHRRPDCAGTSDPEVLPGWAEGEFAQGARLRPDGARVWVSSRRYTQEVYDLFIEAPGARRRLAVRNVHPRLWVDPESGSVLVGRFELTARKQRRLFLWEVPRAGRARRILDLAGSFTPLGQLDGRLYFLNWTAGTLRVMSVPWQPLAQRRADVGTPALATATVVLDTVRSGTSDPAGEGSPGVVPASGAGAGPTPGVSDRAETGGAREEYRFPAHLQPLEVALDTVGRRLVFVLRDGGSSYLCRDRLQRSPTACPDVLHVASGTIRAPVVVGEGVLFAAEGPFQTVQVYRWSPGQPQEPGEEGAVKERPPRRSPPPSSLPRPNLGDAAGTPGQESREAAGERMEGGRVARLTSVPGGVWDFAVDADGWILGSTLQDGRFRTLRLPSPVLAEEDARAVPFPCDQEKGAGLASRRYQPEFRSSYWLPKVSRDDQGGVFGVYSFRADRLDRSRLVVSPTYGFKSRNWGYLAEFMRRFDLWRFVVGAEDRVVRKSYLSNAYYERIRSFDLSLTYPFDLATTLTIGGNLSHRRIAKFPDNGAPAPTVGLDHSVYGKVDYRAIRTEPFWELFPRQGRRATASWRKGLDLFDGELKYDSMALRYEEYLPLGGPWVLMARGWFAEDDKEGDIRRPEDLSLGGTDFLRGYPGAVRFGDSLRAFSLHLARPFHIEIPVLRPWVQEEIIVAEAFWERGDVRATGRRFDFLEDRGLEVRARGLLLRRIPAAIRVGVAWPTGGGPRHDYWMVDFSSVTGIMP